MKRTPETIKILTDQVAALKRAHKFARHPKDKTELNGQIDVLSKRIKGMGGNPDGV